VTDQPPAELGRTPPDFEAIRLAARSSCYDWYLAALLAPRSKRADLLCLAAFAGEILRIPAVVSEPMMGAIRLQWWRDALSEATSIRTGNPVADGLRDCMVGHKLPVGRLLAMIDSMEHEARPGADTEPKDRAIHYNKFWGNLIDLSARILAEDPARLPQDLVFSAATAYGAALSACQADNAEEREVDAAMAVESLRAFRAKHRATPSRLRYALLPVAITEPYLRGSEKGEHPSDLTKAWRLLLAWWRGRV
jgi:15-cis-phytoene synthase